MPGPHGTAVGDVEPSGHAYPAAHGPLHAAVDSPDALPNRPAGHGPLQFALGSALPAPYWPTGHRLHNDDAAPLYCPGAQGDAVAEVEPDGQVYPAGHAPLHVSAT